MSICMSFFSPEQLEEWKKVHDVTVFECVDSKGITHQVAIKYPDWPTLKNISNFIVRNDHAGAGDLIIANCWLGGSDKVKEDPKLRMGFCMVAVNAISTEIPGWEKSPLG